MLLLLLLVLQASHPPCNPLTSFARSMSLGRRCNPSRKCLFTTSMLSWIRRTGHGKARQGQVREEASGFDLIRSICTSYGYRTAELTRPLGVFFHSRNLGLSSPYHSLPSCFSSPCLTLHFFSFLTDKPPHRADVLELELEPAQGHNHRTGPCPPTLATTTTCGRAPLLRLMRDAK